MVMNDQKYPKEGYRFEFYENQYDITAVIDKLSLKSKHVFFSELV